MCNQQWQHFWFEIIGWLSIQTFLMNCPSWFPKTNGSGGETWNLGYHRGHWYVRRTSPNQVVFHCWNVSVSFHPALMGRRLLCNGLNTPSLEDFKWQLHVDCTTKWSKSVSAELHHTTDRVKATPQVLPEKPARTYATVWSQHLFKPLNILKHP